MNNKHGFTNQSKHGVINMNFRKTAVEPTWLLINLVIELKQVCI